MQLPHESPTNVPRMHPKIRALADGQSWHDVCALEDIIPGTGVAALIGRHQIAVVRGQDGRSLYALSNYDPFSHAFVVARGIVGDRGSIPKIASPIYKQNFDLRSGKCLDDPEVRLPVYPVRLSAGRVQVGLEESARP